MKQKVSFRLLLWVSALWLGSPADGFSGPPPVEGGFSMVVLPDTQFYAWKYPETYLNQTAWIAANAERYAIAAVMHVGDVTQNNTPEEWEVAVRAHRSLDGKIPYLLVPGNHDYEGPNGKSDSRRTLMSRYFPLAAMKRSSTYGGVYDAEPDRVENSYQLLTAGGRDWLILGLEFGPRDDVLRWANEVVKRHATRSVIVVTHAYLRSDSTRFDRTVLVEGEKAPNKGMDRYAADVLVRAPEGYNDGEDVWRKLISQHENMVLVFSGHVTITGRLTSLGRHGNRVHQLLVDYQSVENGGNGYLRLLQFLPDGRTVRVRDYSTTLDKTVESPDRVFDLDLPPSRSNPPK